MSNPPDPKACSERADSLSVSDPLAVSDPEVTDATTSSLEADEARRPPRRKERTRVKASKRQREAAAAAADEAHVKLMANCTIRDCGALKADLGAVVTSAESVSIDVSALERIDTAALQLLCAFVRERKQRQLEVTWHGTSAALTEAVRLLGIATVLGICATPAAAS
jgi:ABC-type transporter Mla MlaB component